ncbi:Metallo-hydrolase/oxidoreductase [Fomes fomentarius]|nr:Metallo-hydrolase/oxidoreductase [Fomes fomentarius]
MSLPPPLTNQPFVRVSPLLAGFVNIPLACFLDGAADTTIIECPALCFLIQHPNGRNFLFDLGTRKDWQTASPPASIKFLTELTKLGVKCNLTVDEDVVHALAKGNAKPGDIAYVCYSHLHPDHTGDASLFPTSTFLTGEGSRPLVENGYPKDPDASISQDTLPEGRTTFLSPESWPALGPFPHTLDFYGDGSLYIVDAGHGHIPGHLNLLVRTSADGGWLYLAGDSAHDWSLITGDGKIGNHPVFGCAHMDVAATQAHLARIRELLKQPRVRVLLSHDRDWFEKSKDGPAFWPGAIESL